MRFIVALLSILLVNCSHNIYYSTTGEKTYSAFLYISKKYQQFFLTCKAPKYDKAFYFQIPRASCDSFILFTNELISQKPLKEKKVFYSISLTGKNAFSPSADQLLLLDKAKYILDSLHWCPRTLLDDLSKLRFTELSATK